MHPLCHNGLKKGAGHFLKDNIQQKRNEFDSYTTTYFISLNKPCCQYTRITTLKPLQSVVSALAQPNISHTHTEWDCASIQTVRLPTQVGNKPTCNTLIKRQLKGKKSVEHDDDDDEHSLEFTSRYYQDGFNKGKKMIYYSDICFFVSFAVFTLLKPLFGY